MEKNVRPKNFMISNKFQTMIEFVKDYVPNISLTLNPN